MSTNYNKVAKDSFETTDDPIISYGRYTMLYKKNNKYLIAIGPHWWVTIIGFSLLIGMSIALAIPLCQILDGWKIFIYFLLMSIMLFFYFLTFLKNPGVLGQRNKDEEGNEEYGCNVCFIGKDVDADHCYDCDVCIEGLDHHCVWTGKCIGKDNLMVFYCFVGSVPVFFCFSLMMTVFSIGNSTNHH